MQQPNRETEITITEASAAPRPTRADAASGAWEQCPEAMPARLGCREAAKPGALWGLQQQLGLQDGHTLHGSHVLTGV